MLRFYKYIYYRAYCAGLRGFGNASTAVWGACTELGVLIILNVIGLSGLLQVITGYGAFTAILHAPTLEQAGVLLLFGVWMNRVLGSEKKAKEIAKEFENEEETKKLRFWKGAAVTAYEASWLVLNIACDFFVH